MRPTSESAYYFFVAVVMNIRSLLLESTSVKFSIYGTKYLFSRIGTDVNSLSTASRSIAADSRALRFGAVMLRTDTIASLGHLYGIALLIDQFVLPFSFYCAFSLSVLLTRKFIAQKTNDFTPLTSSPLILCLTICDEQELDHLYRKDKKCFVTTYSRHSIYILCGKANS